MVARLQYLRFCLCEMYVNVVFVMFVQCSEFNNSEQRFIRIIYYYYYTSLPSTNKGVN